MNACRPLSKSSSGAFIGRIKASNVSTIIRSQALPSAASTTSIDPSPPSAIGSFTTFACPPPTMQRRTAASKASATPAAEREPLNLSGTIKILCIFVIIEV